jgi:hypothetical protein
MDDIQRDMIRKLCKFAEKVFSEDWVPTIKFEHQ